MSARRWPRHPALWVSTTYFAEGYPYAVVHSFAEVLFTELGASLQAIGLTSLLHLPWNLKFLWGPFLDAYGTKRAWIAGIEGGILLCLVGLAAATLGTPGLAVPTLLFAALALLSATHDIAIDAYYLEGLDEGAQARWVGLRAPAYRVALLVIGGPALVLADRAGFAATFAACAALFAALVAYHVLLLPEVEARARPLSALLAPKPLLALASLGLVGGLVAFLSAPERAKALSAAFARRAPGLAELVGKLGLSGIILIVLLAGLLGTLAALPYLKRRLDRSEGFYAAAFVSFLEKPHVGRILWFVLFFRTGESFLMKMKYPFFKSLGMSLETFGWASGTIGMVAALVSPAIGGWLIARDGLRRWIWPFVIAQNGLNLAYWGLASIAESSPPSVALMTTVITIEMFGAGLGTAVFMVYLMRCPLPGHRAAHMAILTALMSASFTLAGVVSGFLADALGFARYFLLTVAATLPGMAIIPFLPHLEAPRSPAGPTR